MFGFFRRKKKEKEDAAAAQAAAAEFAATDEAAAEPAGASAEGGEPAGATQAPEVQQPQGALVEAAPALKETVVPKEVPAPVEAVAPQAPAEPVVEAPAPEAMGSAPTVEAPAPETVSPAPEAVASVPEEPSVPVSEDAGAPAAGEATVYGESEIVPPTQAMPEAVRPARAGWFARLRGGLARTRSQLGSIFSRNRIDETLYEELETALLASDTGYGTTTWLLDELRERAQRDRINDAATLKTALIDILTELLSPLEKPIDVDRADPLKALAGIEDREEEHE